jgi:hypothetical protein
MKLSFYPAAVLLAIVALILNGAANAHWMRASRHTAEGIEAAYQQHTKYVRDAESVRLTQTGNVLCVVGLAFTLLGVGCMVAAIGRHERGWYLILTGLFVSDVLVLMLLV